MFSASDIYDDIKPIEHDNLDYPVNVESKYSPASKTELTESKTEYPRQIKGIEIISEIQEKIVFSDDRIITIYGCAGSRKTKLLLNYNIRKNQLNILEV